MQTTISLDHIVLEELGAASGNRRATRLLSGNCRPGTGARIGPGRIAVRLC